MDRQYDSIPRQGRHRGSKLSEEPTTSVRAQEAVKPRPENEAAGVMVGAFNKAEGRYRIRRWASSANVTLDKGYEEVRRYPESASLDDLRADAPHGGRFVVLENTRTGEVHFDRQSELSDNWTNKGRYDQVTLFADEESAAAYADSRKN